MLYSDKLISWLKEKKIYLKYSTYTNYCNVIHNHIMPDLGTYHIEELNNDILQELILQKLECGRKDRKGGISFKYAKDIIQILKFTLPFKVDIQLPYHPPKANVLNCFVTTINDHIPIAVYDIPMQFYAKNRQ